VKALKIPDDGLARGHGDRRRREGDARSDLDRLVGPDVGQAGEHEEKNRRRNSPAQESGAGSHDETIRRAASESHFFRNS